MRNEFSTLDIVKSLGIPRERLREWMNRSFIKPTVAADGKGTKAIFTRQDVYGVELFRQLLDRGLDRDLAGLFVDFFHEVLKKNSKFQDYLIIRYGKDKLVGNHDPLIGYTSTFACDEDKIDLRTGTTHFGEQLGEDWLFVHAINAKKLRAGVDTALEKL